MYSSAPAQGVDFALLTIHFVEELFFLMSVESYHLYLVDWHTVQVK